MSTMEGKLDLLASLWQRGAVAEQLSMPGRHVWTIVDPNNSGAPRLSSSLALHKL